MNVTIFTNNVKLVIFDRVRIKSGNVYALFKIKRRNKNMMTFNNVY